MEYKGGGKGSLSSSLAREGGISVCGSQPVFSDAIRDVGGMGGTTGMLVDALLGALILRCLGISFSHLLVASSDDHVHQRHKGTYVFVKPQR